MITIVEPAAFVINALGKQRVSKDTLYRPINFLIFAECDEGYLVYNTLTKHIVLADEAEYAFLTAKKAVDFEQCKELIEGYFLVAEDFDEKKCSRQLKDLYILLDTDNSITSYTILPTTDCNARCFYCCEHGQKRVNMTEQTALDVAKYIVKSSNGNKVSIMWFGGEPLYNIEPINIISDYLKEHKINYKSNIISNAYLFDKKIIESAKDKWNLKAVQVTLDGTEKIYNKTKAYIYKNNINPFEKVINNIRLLAENKISVMVRLNMDLFNKDDLYVLVDYLHKEFGENKYVKIYIRMLFDNTSKVQTERSNEERKFLYREFIKFEDYIEEKGMYHLERMKSSFSASSCVTANKHGTVILPNGELGMCDLKTDSEICGNIYEGVTNQSVIDGFSIYKPPVAGCDKCPIYPNCARLEKCIYYTRDCEEYEQERLILQIKRYMLYTYNKSKES